MSKYGILFMHFLVFHVCEGCDETVLLLFTHFFIKYLRELYHGLNYIASIKKKSLYIFVSLLLYFFNLFTSLKNHILL